MLRDELAQETLPLVYGNPPHEFTRATTEILPDHGRPEIATCVRTLLFESTQQGLVDEAFKVPLTRGRGIYTPLAVDHQPSVIQVVLPERWLETYC